MNTKTNTHVNLRSFLVSLLRRRHRSINFFNCPAGSLRSAIPPSSLSSFFYCANNEATKNKEDVFALLSMGLSISNNCLENARESKHDICKKKPRPNNHLLFSLYRSTAFLRLSHSSSPSNVKELKEQLPI